MSAHCKLRRAFAYLSFLLIAAAGTARGQGGNVMPVQRNSGAGGEADSGAVEQLVYDGRRGQLNVRIPHVEAEAPVDGTLAAPAWRRP